MIQDTLPVQVTQTQLALWLSFVTPVSIAILGIIQVVVAKWASDDRKEVAAKVEIASTKSDVQSNKIDQIHTLVNHDHGVTLRVAAVALRRITDLTNVPEDLEAAAIAEEESKEHDRKQQIIDAGGTL